MNEFHQGDRVIFWGKVFFVVEETDNGVILAGAAGTVVADRRSISHMPAPGARVKDVAGENRASHEF